MKKLTLLLLLTINAAFGQLPTKNAGGFYAGSASMSASAIGQFDSTSKGMLIPRMTTTQRNAISSPATGLQVYNTTTNVLNVYNGTSWVEVGSGSTPTLQAVTTAGATTTNTITVSDNATGDFTLTNPTDFEVHGGTNGKRAYYTTNLISFGRNYGADYYNIIPPSTLTTTRNVTLPNKSGTVAFLDDITSASSLQAVTNIGNTITAGSSVLTLSGNQLDITESTNSTNLSQGTLEFSSSSADAQYGISAIQFIDGAKQAVYDIDQLAYTTSTGGLILAHGTQTGYHTATFPNKTGTVAMTSDIPATISDITKGSTYTSGLAKTTDASGSIKIGDWNNTVNGTTLEVNDTSKTIGIVGQVNQHFGNYVDDTVDSSSFAIGPYTMTFTGKSGTSVDNFGTGTLLVSPEEGNMLKKTAANGDYTQIVQDIDAHYTSIQSYDDSTTTTSSVTVIPNDIAFTAQSSSDAYGLDLTTTSFSVIDENRTDEYALHLETGSSELNAGQLANNTLTLSAYDVNGTSMTPFIELKSNNIPTMTLPQLAGSGTRMVTVTSTGEVGATTIPSGGGGSITLTTTGSSGAATLVSDVLNVPNYTLSGLGGVAANSSITGATKTKVTYDSKGLVTAGADATTADIADSTDKRYVTDAQLALFTSLQTRISQSVALSMFFTAISPADATNYFASPLAQTLSTTESNRKFKMPYATTFRSVQLCMTQSASSTSETVSVYLRNYTAGTETLVGTFISNFTGNTTFNFTGLSIAIPNTTDEWDVKIATPTWTTNPTSWSGTITVIAN